MFKNSSSTEPARNRRQVTAAGLSLETAPVRFLACVFALLAFTLLPAATLLAQPAPKPAPKPIRDFYWPERFDAPNQRILKTAVIGREALQQPGAKYAIKGLRIESFRLAGVTNQLELAMEAPDCLFDSQTQEARSPGPLRIRSGDGKMQIEGRGFLWGKVGESSVLMISNQVHTIVERGVLAPAGGAATGVSPAPTGTNQILHIYSDNFLFDRQSNVITYTGTVRGEDSQMQLTCEVITIRRAPGGGVEEIVADRNVVITTRENGDHITGSRAVYTAREGRQVVELTGRPHWQHGAGEATAKVFYFDQTRRVLRTEGEAYLKLARNSINQTDFLSAPASPVTPTAEEQFVEIFSDNMRFQLPPTNGPLQGVTADKNVLILDPKGNSRASGGHASYVEASRTLELVEEAFWQSDERVARGGILIFDQNHQSFTARTNAYLKFPAASLGDSPLLGGRGSRLTTNQFVEVLADDYEYRDHELTFHKQVRAGLVQGENIRGTLESSSLKVGFTRGNQLQSVAAEGGVYGRLLPFREANGRTMEREIRGDLLNVQLRTNGLIKEIVAERNVLATQTEMRTNGSPPLHLSFAADWLRATFLTTTNQVDTAVAKRNVILRRDDLLARGQKAVYSGATEIAELTGNPTVDRQGTTASNLDKILYNRVKGTVSLVRSNAQQFVVHVKLPPAAEKKAAAAGADKKKAP